MIIVTTTRLWKGDVMRKRMGDVRKSRGEIGFTLIELMTVVAILGILVAIALPSYQDSVRKGRRGQAKSDLVELATRAERFYTTQGTYAGFDDEMSTEDEQSPREGDAHYTVAINIADDGQAFTLTATPVGGQTGDTRCGALSLTAAGEKTENGTGTVQDCW